VEDKSEDPLTATWIRRFVRRQGQRMKGLAARRTDIAPDLHGPGRDEVQRPPLALGVHGLAGEDVVPTVGGAKVPGPDPALDGAGDPVGGVSAHVGDLATALGAQLVEEAVERGLVATLGSPEQAD
jgi:hypothetical protein